MKIVRVLTGALRVIKTASDRRLTVHANGTFSVRVKRWSRWKWEHDCTDIRLSDFRRLQPEEQARLRALEQRTGRIIVVADTDYIDG